MSAKLTFSPTKPSEVIDAVEDILFKASEALTIDNLNAAVYELSKLPEKEKRAIGVFLTALNERIALDQAMKAVKAHVSLLSATLA